MSILDLVYLRLLSNITIATEDHEMRMMILIANDLDIDALLPLTINNGNLIEMQTARYDTKLFVMGFIIMLLTYTE